MSTSARPWERLEGKVQPWHRDRLAVVYVRQSTAQQVVDHQESTRLQYGLAERAVGLGWAPWSADPNHFDGPVRLFRAGAETNDWEDVPVGAATRAPSAATASLTWQPPTLPTPRTARTAASPITSWRPWRRCSPRPKPDSRSTSPAPPCGPLPYRRTRAGRSPRTPAADTEEAKEHSS